MSFNKLLIISGPTASGKTSLALKLAQKFNGELISADSRQIYKGMDIGTGKDFGNNPIFNFQFSIDKKNVGYYLVNNVPLWLTDIIYPNQAFSVAEYRQLALRAIKDIQSRGKLPIIVGGTGQYIDAIINPQPTFSVKPNPLIRFFLDRFSLRLLQFTLRTFDFKTYDLLNNSDLHNPRRLIRKIEISLFNFFSTFFPKFGFMTGRRYPPLSKRGRGDFDYLHLSLTAPNNYLFPRVDKRVEERLDAGLLDEIKTLLQKYSWSHPGLNTLAYKEFKSCFQPKVGVWLAQTHKSNRNKELTECIDRWRYDEHAYVRRQKTWFKKVPDINFIDITHKEFSLTVFDLVASFLKL